MELVELGTLLEMEKGKKPAIVSVEPKEGFLPYVDIDVFEKGIIKQYTEGSKCTPCEDGDILIVCDGSRSGLVGKAVKGYVGSTLARISAPGLIRDYLYHFVQGKYALLNTRKKGTGTPHLNPELLKKQKLVVPDVAEQERIVARIEELFSQLDAGVETLKKTKAQLAVYRQAVLKEAFEGRLTEEWRKSNGTTRTVQDISGKYSAYDFAEACDITFKKTARYREQLVNYFETKNYIFVHSWIVVNKVGIDTYEYREDWRNSSDEEWENAMWLNPYDMAKQDLNKTGKTIVFGHFHTSYQWAKDGKCSEFGEDADFNPYYGKDFIGIDGCTAYTGEVNVIVLEDEFLED